MAFVDLFGATSGGVLGALDVTHRRFEPVEHELLPRGLAWDQEDPVRLALVAANCTELSRVDLRADALLRELDPQTTFALIDDWETELGLPDCAKPETLEARRAAVLAKLLAQGGHDQGPGWWSDLLAKLGYPLHFVVNGQQPMNCNDDCMAQLFEAEMMFVWEIAVEPGLDDALLECVVQHNALLATYPVVHFLWTQVVVAEPINFAGVACSSKGYTAAVGGTKVLFVGPEIDEASSWDIAAVQPEDMYAICAVDDVLIAVGVGAANTLRSTDGGATWVSSPIAASELYGVSRGPEGDEVAVAVGEDGSMWRTTNAGIGWTSLLPATAAVLFAVTRCQGAMIAVGFGGVVVRGTNNGLTWAVVAAGIATTLLAVSAWLTTVIAVGSGGSIWRSADAGLTWSQRVSPTAANLRAVTSSPSGRWTACGDAGVILQSLDDGIIWTAQKSPVTENLYGATAHVPTGRALLVGSSTSIVLE